MILEVKIMGEGTLLWYGIFLNSRGKNYMLRIILFPIPGTSAQCVDHHNMRSTKTSYCLSHCTSAPGSRDGLNRPWYIPVQWETCVFQGQFCLNGATGCGWERHRESISLRARARSLARDTPGEHGSGSYILKYKIFNKSLR